MLENYLFIFIFPLLTSILVYQSLYLFFYYKKDILLLKEYLKKNIKKYSLQKILNLINKVNIHEDIYLLLDGEKIDGYLERSKLKLNLTTKSFLILKIITIIIGIIVAMLVHYFAEAPNIAKLFSVFSIIYISIFWPELYFKQRILKNKQLILKELINFIDILRLQINAGANIEIAFRSLGNLNTPLGKEAKEVTFMLDNGISFIDALEKMDKRLEINDFSHIVTIFKQSKELGVSLVDTLQIQSELLRTKRKQKADEFSKTAAVKISIPLVLLIFPASLIIYIAPAILRLLQL